jgi:hypothetical protein
MVMREIVLTQALVAIVTLTVEPTTFVPVEGRIITLVEDAYVPSMRAAPKLEAVKKLV